MKISIITVTYNSAKFINDCLKSVKTQNYNNIEHIVIDGNSTDETLPLLYSKRDQIKELISEPDKGVYDAMNKGIKIATGEVIGFLNSDDFYANNRIISKVASVFNNNSSIDACYADLVYTQQMDTSKTVRYWRSGKFIPNSFSKGWAPPHPTFFARRSIYERFGLFNLNYRFAADNELMMRFMEVYKIKTNYIPEVWVKMRLGGTTNKNFKNIFFGNLEILKALRKNGLYTNIIIFFFHKIFLRLNQRLIIIFKSFFKMEIKK